MKIYNFLFLSALSLALYANCITAKDVEPCKKWDGPLDTDGMQLCPEVENDWALMRCSWHQATTFNAPTLKEKQLTRNLVASLIDGDVASILKIAPQLHLRFCRVKKFDKEKKLIDQYLVGATEPGYKAYNGAFFMHREIKDTIPVLGQNPHMGTDNVTNGTFANTKMAAWIVNGQYKGLATEKVSCEDRKISDAAHSVKHGFYDAHKAYTTLRPDLVVIHLHGMKGDGMLITNGIRRNVGKNSLMYAFTKIVSEKFPNNPKFRACADGTLLTQPKQCHLAQAWVEAKDLTCAKSVQCGTGSTNLDRFIGVEQNVKIAANPHLMASIINELGRTYLANPDRPIKTCQQENQKNDVLAQGMIIHDKKL